MKIGAIGPETTLRVVREVMDRDFPDIQVVYRYLEYFEQSAQAADQFQRQHQVDALLFSGPTNYAYSLRRVAPTIPWGYLAHSHAAALQAALRATAVYGSDLKGVSVDRYDPDFLRSALEAAGVQGTKIYRAPYDPEEPDFEGKLLEFHRDCYRRGQVTACFTSMEHIMDPLLAEGIPCVRTYPVEGVVREEIYHLQVQQFAAQEDRGRLAVVAIQYDYVFDSERDLSLREWEKMRYQNEFKERVYTAAQRMEAAVFESGLNYYLVTSRNTLTDVFLKTGEHWNLIEFGRRTPEYQVWVGIGVGSTTLEAKSRANMALNRSKADQAGRSYLVEDESLEPNSLDVDGDRPAEGGLNRFARRAGLGPETFLRLKEALDRGGDSLTAEELAGRLNVTVRSANRIVSRLEEAGYATLVGRRSAGKGRPARVIKITLPER